ncbi:retention module-containing protein [Campylobacter concisus]|uniref:retention module-containing protein n=1 Tax=Campylobacter concisus TaxID=199 RepID=UPI001652FDE3|nr:retention module-containing protein [Campylobacter concisus]
MAKEAGVVKSVNGGIARALNDLTGEVRQLSVGDIVYQGEKIVTEGSNSKVTITQTDGKDITLIGKDTLTLDQDSNNNETVADISALQQAILKGTDLNALEETAAGGPQAGGNGGDGVSLSSTSFAEGGHISNINANVGSIDALSLAAGGDNSFGVSGGSAVGAGATPVIPPIATITALGSTNATEGQDWNGPEYKFSLGDLDTNGVNNLATRPTTYTFSLSGVEKGVDYEEIETPDGNFIFEYKDVNGDWVPMYGNKLTVNDPRDIENLEVRIAQLANNSIQNQGERVGDDSRFSSIDGAEQGVYERKATVNVTSDNPQIASSSNTGTITDTDDEVSFAKGLDGKTIDTEIGNDIINLHGEIKNGSNVQSGDDDDVINLYGNLTSGSTINTGSENIFGTNSHDTVNVKSGASVDGATSSITRSCDL